MTPGTSASALQRRALADAVTSVRAGCPAPDLTDGHRARCAACRLSPDDLAELELRYLAWHPVAELAAELLPALERSAAARSIRTHAAAALWDLRRCGDLAGAYSRLIDGGLARADDATPADALRALRDLAAELRRVDGAGDPGRPAPAQEPVNGEAAAVVETYEARIRRTRRQLSGPITSTRTTPSREDDDPTDPPDDDATTETASLVERARALAVPTRPRGLDRSNAVFSGSPPPPQSESHEFLESESQQFAADGAAVKEQP